MPSSLPVGRVGALHVRKHEPRAPRLHFGPQERIGTVRGVRKNDSWPESWLDPAQSTHIVRTIRARGLDVVVGDIESKNGAI